jgi:hypothetical protein
MYTAFNSQSHKNLEPTSYRAALMSTLLHATVYVYTQFAECTIVEIANKIGLHQKKKKKKIHRKRFK